MSRESVTLSTTAVSAPAWRKTAKSLLPFLAIGAVALLFHWWSDGSFLTSRNLSNLSRQVCVNLTLAVGMTMVILTSGIDLSVGSVLALAGMVAAISQVHWHFADWGLAGAALSFGLAIGVGAVSGGITGYAISRLNITPFIVSLGMMVIARGAALIVSDAQAVAPVGATLGKISAGYLPPMESFILLTVVLVAGLALVLRQRLSNSLSTGNAIQNAFLISVWCLLGVAVFCGYRGIPYMVFLAVFCALAGMYVLKYTRYGRFLFAIGGNREAAELSGVPVKRTLSLTYLVMGCLAGLAGVLDTARVNGAVPSAGELAELDAIAAVVIGGTSLMGGSGTIAGTLFGVLMMGILNNGMSLVGVSEHYQKVFKGLVIILAVYLDMRSKKK